MEEFIIQSGNASWYNTVYSCDSTQKNEAYSAEAVNSARGVVQLDSTENSVVLEKDSSGKYKLTSFSREAAANLPTIRESISSDDKLSALLDRCIESRSPLNLFVTEKNSGSAYRLLLLPIIHTRCTRVLLNAERISSKTEGGSAEQACSCFITEDSSGRSVRGASLKFSNFLSSHRLCCEDICALRPVSDSLKRGLPSSSPLILNSLKGNTEFYMAYTLPMSGEYSSQVVVLSIVPVRLYLQPDSEGRQKNITKREREIINLVSSGYPNKYIAHKLEISEGTVKKTLHNAYKKLGVNSRTELVNLFHSML